MTSPSRAATPRVRRWSAVLVVVAAPLLVGCGVVWDAPNVGFTVQRDAIVYTQPDGYEQLVGGETVLQVANASPVPRQIVVALVPEGEAIPSEVLEAEAAREDDRIVGYSAVLDPQEVSAGEGLGRRTETAAFHLHLRDGERYVIFDTLSDADGPVRWLEPGPDGDRLVAAP